MTLKPYPLMLLTRVTWEAEKGGWRGREKRWEDGGRERREGRMEGEREEMGGWRGREKRREDGGGERRDGRKVLTLTAKVCCPGFWNPKPGVPSYLESDVGTFTFSFLPFCSSSS